MARLACRVPRFMLFGLFSVSSCVSALVERFGLRFQELGHCLAWSLDVKQPAWHSARHMYVIPCKSRIPKRDYEILSPTLRSSSSAAEMKCL